MNLDGETLQNQDVIDLLTKDKPQVSILLRLSTYTFDGERGYRLARVSGRISTSRVGSR